MSRPADASPAPFFTGDHLALDFLNSRSTLKGFRTDWIRDGSEFLGWLELAGVTDGSTASILRAEGLALDEVAGRARDLREWLRGFVGRHAGRELTDADSAELGLLNELLAEGNLHLRIDSGVERCGTPAIGGRPFCLTRVRRRSVTDQFLQPIVLAIAELVCHENFRLVRECEGKDCGRFFLDRCKSHARRWCSMRLCGNRAKATAHRAKGSRGQ